MTRDARLILAGNPGAMTGRGNNTWLIDGAEPTLVDAGTGEASHVEAVAAALGGRALARVLVTHGHADHASGVPALRARWPGIDACRFVPERGGAAADATAPGPWTPLADGATVRAGDRDLVVLHTPGHAIDHVCFWDAATRDVYTGDMLVQGSTVMIPAGRGGGLRAYLASLGRIAALNPARAFPGHGPIIESPAGLIAEYIAHRELRDRQVAALVREGVTDLDAMVDRIYPDLPAALRSAARATVEAHLEQLGHAREP